MRFDFPAAASRTALLVVDMQRIFLDPASPLCIPGGAALVPALNALAAQCREAGVPVLFSATTHKPDGSDLGLLTEGRTAWLRANPYLVDPEWTALHPDVERKAQDTFIPKTRYSVFYKTPLEDWLAKHRRDTLIIGGVATTACCAATARDAYFRDIRPIVLSDGSATYGIADLGFGACDAEQSHRSTLADLARHCARVTTIGMVSQELLPGTALASKPGHGHHPADSGRSPRAAPAVRDS
jgi:ureidoacrylate peracid hydrolase